MYVYRARLERDQPHLRTIVDGDTLRLEVELGFGARLSLGKTRLYGINAPEITGKDRVKGEAARNWLVNKLSNVDTFEVRTLDSKHLNIRDKRGSFSRWLVILKLDNDKLSLNDQMVIDGHAVIARYR